MKAIQMCVSERLGFRAEIAILTGMLFASSAGAGPIATLGTSGLPGYSSQLGTIDLGTGIATLGATISPRVSTVNDLAYVGSTLYGLVSPDRSLPNFVTVNPQTGVPTVIATGVSYDSIAVSPGGIIYGCDGLS